MLIMFDENMNVRPVEKPRKPRFEKEEQLIRWETAKWDEPMQENIVVSAPYRKGELVRRRRLRLAILCAFVPSITRERREC